MNNMGGLLQQAQQMQRKMLEIDKKLSEMEVSGEVSNGLVKVIMTGKGVVKSIKIDSSLKEDIEVLEDLKSISPETYERLKSELYAIVEDEKDCLHLDLGRGWSHVSSLLQYGTSMKPSTLVGRLGRMVVKPNMNIVDIS